MGRKRKSKKRGPAPKRHHKFDEKAFYSKYPHVVSGSVKEVKPGTKIDGVIATHKRICKVKCEECSKVRTINVQDAFQVKLCLEHQTIKAKAKISARRSKAKKKS